MAKSCHVLSLDLLKASSLFSSRLLMTQDPVFEIEKLLDGLHSPQLSSKLIFSNQTLKKMPNFFVKF